MTFHNVPTDIPDPEVVPKAKRRKFSAEYKRRAPGRAVLVPPVDLAAAEGPRRRQGIEPPGGLARSTLLESELQQRNQS
jgi:hypothetical protein